MPLIKSYFYNKSIHIFELISEMCENVNVNFQSFFRKQNKDDAYSPNCNFIEEICKYINFLLEDSTIQMYYKSTLLRCAIQSLIELSSGSSENRQMICDNKRIFVLLNQKISKFTERLFLPKSDTMAIKELDYISYEIFCSSTELLVSIVKVIHDNQSLSVICSSFQIENLLELFYFVYRLNFKG